MRRRTAMRFTSLQKEWRIFACIMLCAAALFGYVGGTGQPARLIYDMLMRTVDHPKMDEVVIVAIDDRSVEAIGRWPWPRDNHAHLLDIFTEGGARAVGLDILLFEPGRQPTEQEDDAKLAASIARNGRTVLPVVLEHGTAVSRAALPLPLLAEAAAGLGHTHFTFDTDGFLRRIHLLEETANGVYPQFALAMHEVAGNPATAHTHTRTDTHLPSHARARSLASRHTHSESLHHAPHDDVHATDDSHQINIPFAGPPGHTRTVSYDDVLSGRIEPGFFKDKYVLVGATAAGLAMVIPTPLTNGAIGMSGVEVNANILSALVRGNKIGNASPWQTALFGVLATLMSLLVCRYLSPLRALLCTVLLAAGILLVTLVAFRQGLWLPPGASIGMVLVVYPLWSWRRLEAALAFLSEEFARLNRGATIVFGSERPMANGRDTDFFDRRIIELRLAADQARDLQRFAADSLDSIPDPTFVLSPKGEVLMYNRAAKLYLDSTVGPVSPPFPLETAFSRMDAIRPGHWQSLQWRDLLLKADEERSMVEIEARDRNGREFLVKGAVSKGSDGKTLGWIVLLVDVTTLRAAERHRDETLDFISHDMRAPQSSILALLTLQKNPQTAFPTEEFYSRVEKSVQSTLALADDFVHLAKAKSSAYHRQEADIHSMLADAADDMWAFARSRGIKIVIDVQTGDDWIHVDRPLMVRALGNLLSNAIKFSPPGGEVTCSARTVHENGRNSIICSIADRGIGMSAVLQEQIFSPFPRREKSGREGVGLGLAFVKMVVERHGGTIGFESRPGGGSTFVLSIPCITDTAIDPDPGLSAKPQNTGIES